MVKRSRREMADLIAYYNKRAVYFGRRPIVTLARFRERVALWLAPWLRRQ